MDHINRIAVKVSFINYRNMKKLTIILGILAVSASAISCQKELTEGQAANAVPQITKTMYVEGNEWLPEDGTKTSFQPETGIVWDGTEQIGVYYANSASTGTSASDKYMVNRAKNVTSVGDGMYSFTHDLIDGAEAYDYAVIVPDLTNTGLNGPGTAASFKFSPVQNPGQNTYDPNYDILFAQGVMNVQASEQISVTKFKRVTAPLKVEVKDSKNLVGDEKVHAVTTSFSQPAVKNSGLAGLFYLKFGYEYEDCKLNSIEAASNTLTAVYTDGLQKLGDNYPVWYMASPLEITSGDITVTVVTDTRTISRTVALSSPVNIELNNFNIVDFDISGEGYTVENTIYQDFTYLSQGELPESLLASNGKAYNWSFTGCQVAYDTYNGLLPHGLRTNKVNASITLPDIPGKDIVKIRLYAYPNNAQKTNTITLNGGETSYDFCSYADNTLTGNTGILEITVPAEEAGKPLTLSSTSNYTAFSAMSFVVEDNDEDVPVVENNDYYALYNAGETIVINGEEYNIATHGAPVLHEDISALTFDDIKSAGVHFIDNSGQAETKELTGTALANKTVLIGRYKDSQPALRFLREGGDPGQLSIRSDVVLKNIHVVSNHGTSIFANSGAKDDQESNLVLEDCTLTCESKCPAVISENNDTKSFVSVTVNNCVVEYSKANSNIFVYPLGKVVAEGSTTPSKTVFAGKNVTIKNTAVYSKSLISGGLVSLGNNNYHSNSTDLDIVVENNTLYNISAQNIVVRAYIAKSLTVKDNVAYYTGGTVKSYLTAVYDTNNFPASSASISGNYLYTDYQANTNFWGLVHTGSFKDSVSEGNFLHSQAEGCISTGAVNLETGYIPVNTSVVTNGAGADYDTKYWVQK